jgi:hypothetical protein
MTYYGHNECGQQSADSPLMNDFKSLASKLLASPRRWVVLRVLCAILWACELFWIQSLAFGQPPWIRYPFLTQLIRFYFNLVFAASLVFLVRRRYLSALLGGCLIVSVVLATYSSIFHWPFMPARILSEWQDGWSIRWQLASAITLGAAALLLLVFCVKFLLLLKSGRSDVSWPVWRRILLVAVAAYVLPVMALQLTNLRLSIGPNGGFGRGVFAYGYSLPWACDLLANSDVEEHSIRAKVYLTHHYDRITPLESPLVVTGSVVVLQLESVDTRAIQARYSGRDVMPFLKKLQDQSMFFRICAFHRNGSCDMDYAATTDIEPYPGMVPYRLRGMAYTNTQPQFMEMHGFDTYVFHGNTAIFYDRGPAMEEVGFKHILFKEQLAEQHLPSSIMGVRDAPLFRCMSDVLRSHKHIYVFGITVDTHTPFQLLEPKEMEIFPRPKSADERYLNSARYLDNCLREFVNNLPGGTTLVMYGDHTTSLHTAIFDADDADGKEYVGCLIYQKESNLSALQQTRQQPLANDGSLNLIDVLSYLRNSINCGGKPAGANTPAALPKSKL